MLSLATNEQIWRRLNVLKQKKFIFIRRRIVGPTQGYNIYNWLPKALLICISRWQFHILFKIESSKE